LVPAKFTTLRHFSVSAAIKAAKSSGEPPKGADPQFGQPLVDVQVAQRLVDLSV
jgi:hypothetical protein